MRQGLDSTLCTAFPVVLPGCSNTNNVMLMQSQRLKIRKFTVQGTVGPSVIPVDVKCRETWSVCWSWWVRGLEDLVTLSKSTLRGMGHTAFLSDFISYS